MDRFIADSPVPESLVSGIKIVQLRITKCHFLTDALFLFSFSVNSGPEAAGAIGDDFSGQQHMA